MERSSKSLWERQYELILLEFLTHGARDFLNNLEEKIVKGRVMLVYNPKDAEYSHLLNNLIQEYTSYEPIECTEKQYLDNTGKAAAANKVIFPGKTQASKKHWNNLRGYSYEENGMCFGTFVNHAFLAVKPLTGEAEKSACIDAYNQKITSFANTANIISTDIKDEIVKVNPGVFAGVGGALTLLACGFPGIITAAYNAGIGAAVGSIINKIRKSNSTNELMTHQYRLLFCEFVFNELDKFMEGR